MTTDLGNLKGSPSSRMELKENQRKSKQLIFRNMITNIASVAQRPLTSLWSPASTAGTYSRTQDAEQADS